MTKHVAWLGAAALMVSLCTGIQVANAQASEPLKPYVVMILDTSGSMGPDLGSGGGPTGSGPPSCGGIDTKLNHARCAINNITNSYGDMVFALARFRMTMGGTTTANTFPAGCTSPQVNCLDGEGDAGNHFELLTPLIDGNNEEAAVWTNFTGNTCTATGGLPTNDPEIWLASGGTPIGGSLKGAKLYWSGVETSTDSTMTQIWDDLAPGFAPIANDTKRNEFLPQAGSNAPTCNPHPSDPDGGGPLVACTATTPCTGANCCCAEQCRPYITIMLTDGDENCAGADFNVTTVGPAPNGAIPSLLQTDLITNNPLMPGNPATLKRYRVETKPIGFGKNPGDAQIEAMAHAGGAFNNPALNEGYYASDEAGLQLAISQILDDAIRTEECNFKDDDCDSLVDEGFATGATCNNGRLGKCRVNGANGCRADGTNVECSAGLGPTGAGPSNVPPACPACGCSSKALNAACTVVNAANTIVNGTCLAGNPALTCVPTPATGASLPDPADNEIPTGCNNIDDDCDGFIDEGVTGCSCIPQPEKCNGLNDDCDGATDEGLTINCNNGTCLGTRVCNPNLVVGGMACNRDQTNPNAADSCWTACSADTPDPLGENICDGLDDNCDGNADGFTESCSNMFCPGGACTNGRCVGGAQAGEVCGTFPTAFDPRNNPGSAASGLPAPNCASLGAQCICQPGSRVCQLNGMGSYGDCLGEVEPGIEVCNDLDDDCDGKVDESPPVSCVNDSDCPSITPDCVTGAGGVKTCQFADCSVNMCGGRLECVGGVQTCTQVTGTDDTCNAVDEDCDGMFDEGWVCDDPDGLDNIPGNADDCGCSAAGQCGPKQTCQNGSKVCLGEPVGTEICDCDDNNCNGEIDEGTLCGAGSCVDCQCAFPCSDSEFPCPVGRRCNAANFCVVDPCFGVTCPTVAGDVQTCRPNAANPTEFECVSACDPTVTQCNPGSVCVPAVGECRPDDCRTFPDRCSASQSCINGACVGNPCAEVTCSNGQYCNDGNCFSSCADVTCATGERCVLGECVDSPCDRACPFGQACNEQSGECRPDVCGSFECPQGQWCNPELGGGCVDDPCALFDITCADGEVCRNGTCYDAEQFLPDAGVETRVTTGGGGGCSTSSNPGSLIVGLGIVLGLSLRRRRQVMKAAAVAVLAASTVMLGCNVNDYCINCATGDGGNGGDGGGDDGGGDDGGGDDGGGVGDGGPGDGGCSAVQGPEECDGEDNDCNGQVDENPGTLPQIGDPCDVLLGECAGGVKQCSNGRIVCSKPASPEMCDLLDNNCNGQTDEGDPGGGASCGTDTGECVAGQNRCVNGAIACENSKGPATEECNNRDDDCDGTFDEGITLGACVAGQDGPSAGDTGECVLGNRECRSGVIQCVGAVFPTFELCDTNTPPQDSDCNGQPSNGYNTMTDTQNCGGCGTACNLAQAFPKCEGGACKVAACEPNFFNNDGLDSNGCEFDCGHPSFGAEICNGIDDDCDGLVDTADSSMVIPGNNCDVDGACSTGTTFTCDGVNGFRCHYTGPNVQIQTSPTVDDTKIVSETRCDSDLFTGLQAQQADNDCDVRVDEGQANLGAACNNNQQGVCRSTGTFVCDSTDATTRLGPAVCVFTQMGVSPSTEICDGLDNNCNNIVDDGASTGSMGQANGQTWSDIPGSNPVRQIMTYEASRPGSTPTDGGTLETHVCSRDGVQPWANVKYPQALAACQAIGADLCSEAEWQSDCEPDAMFPVAGPADADVTTFSFIEAEDGTVTNIGPAAQAWTARAPTNYNGTTAMGTSENGFSQLLHASALAQSSRIDFPMTLLANTDYRVFVRMRQTLTTAVATPTRTATPASATLSPVSAAATEVGDLVIVTTLTQVTNGTAITHTLQAGFVELAAQTLDDGNNDARMSIAYQIVTTAGAQTYSAYASPNGTNLSGIVVLRRGSYDVNALVARGRSTSNNVINGASAGEVGVPSFVFSFAGWHHGTSNNGVDAPTNYNEIFDTPSNLPGELAAAILNTQIEPGASTADPGDWGDNVSPNGTLNITLVMLAPRFQSVFVGINPAPAAPQTIANGSVANAWHWASSGIVTTGAATAQTVSVYLREDGVEVDTIAVARHGSIPTFDNAWAFATNPRTYVATTCNGDDLDTDTVTAGDQDGILPTGPATGRMSCFAEHGVHDTWDLSGNVKEWTKARAAGQNPIRGGAANNEASGMTCKSSFTLANDDFFFPNVGFRCCRTKP